MKIEFLQGKEAANYGVSLREGEALVFIDNKPVQQEIIDRFNQHGQYVGERATGLIAKLVVNLYKVSVDLVSEFNEHVQGVKMIDIDDKDSWIEIALIPSQVRQLDGSYKADFYISERLNDRMYTRPSEKYLKNMQDGNRKWGKQVLDDEQSN